MATQYPFNYGFPLFVPDTSRAYLIKHEKNRVSDIWGFWDYLVKIHARKRNPRHEQFLQTLLEQAKYFFEAAEVAPLHSQPLLYYYSFLNVAKIVINIYHPMGNTVEYYHGIETKVNSTTNLSSAMVTFKQYGGIGSTHISVAKEFINLLGDSIIVPHPTSIKKLLASCIGVHRTYCETFNEKEAFYRLLNTKEIEKDGMDITYYSIIKNVDANSFLTLSRRGYNIISNADGTYGLKINYRMPNYNIGFQSWKNLKNAVLANGMWSYTDGNDYRLYISDNAELFSSASIIYCIMFFLGSVTRYHPYFFDNLLSAKEQWLIDEFLHTQPLQFMYMITSKVVGNYVYHTRQMLK